MNIGNNKVSKINCNGTLINRVFQNGEIIYGTLYTKPEPIPEFTGLTFTAEEANSTIIYNKSTSTSAKYSTDKINWINANGITITLQNVGDKVYFKGSIDSDQSIGSTAKFSMTGKISASGNIQSLMNENMSNDIIYNNCYASLFSNCTSLTTAPELPATTLSDGCYRSMFQNCTSLTTAPELPATITKTQCYYYMFYGCTSLINAPELQSSTLTEYCYAYMFQNCTSLTTAPELPAITPARRCYNYMFNGCSNLNYIKVALSSNNIGGIYVTEQWVDGVTGTGLFIKNINNTAQNKGYSWCPINFTIQNYTPS